MLRFVSVFASNTHAPGPLPSRPGGVLSIAGRRTCLPGGERTFVSAGFGSWMRVVVGVSHALGREVCVDLSGRE